MANSSSNAETATETTETSTTTTTTQSEEQLEMLNQLIEAELSSVERTLQAPRSGHGGRAGFNSVADSLRSIAERLRSSTAAAAVGSTDTHSLAREASSRFSERLETAQLAHASHVPLDVVRQRSIRNNSSLVASRSSEELQLQRSRQAGSLRNASPLVASRSRASLLLVAEQDLFPHNEQLHHALSERKLSALQENSDDTIDNDEDDNYDGDGGPEMMEVEESETTETSKHVSVLLTKRQSLRMDATSDNTSNNNNVNSASVLSGSIMNTTTNNTNTTSQQRQQQPEQSGSLIYSWGSGFIASLHDDDNDDNDNQNQHQDTKHNVAESSLVSVTSRLGRPGAAAIVSVATSTTHTVAATCQGSVLACGENLHGAVDPTCRKSQYIARPTHLEVLGDNIQIRMVSCGHDHTAALTQHGTVLTWGSNQHGHLGHRKSSSNSTGNTNSTYCHPQGLVLTRGRRAAAVACGHFFTLVLTTRMCVLACGVECITGRTAATDAADVDNNDAANINKLAHYLPSQIPALRGLPLVAVAAGHFHAVVLTSSGTAYAWGENASGCCGRPYPQQFSGVPVEMHVPATTLMKQSKQAAAATIMTNTAMSHSALFPNWGVWQDNKDGAVSLADDVAAIHAACGERHTVLVTRSGRLLVCGSNAQGQLGIMGDGDDDDKNNDSVISPVVPLDHPDSGRGCSFVAAEAGTNHTLLLDSDGNVWQMGGGNVCGPECVLANKNILTIAAGGNHSIAVAATGGGAGSSLRRQFSVTQDSSNNTLIADVGSLADNLEELLESVTATESPEDKNFNEEAGQEIAKRTEELLRNPAVLNSLFFDVSELEHVFQKIVSAGNAKVQQTIATAIERGIEKGLAAIAPGSARMIYPEAVRCLLLYIQFFDRPAPCPPCNAGDDCESIAFDVHGRLITSLCEAILGLSFEGYKAFLIWATALYSTRELFVNMLVNPLLAQLDKGLLIKVDSDGVQHMGLTRGSVPSIVTVLSWLYNASERMGEIATQEDFYSDAMDHIPIEALYNDLRLLKKATSMSQEASAFYLCSCPFLFSPRTKRNLLQIENQVEMFKVATSGGGVTFDAGRMEFCVDPFWKLEIEREHLLKQTLAIVKVTKPSDLRRKLMVKFKGEEGVDAGGLTAEFFQLLSLELFDISTGMWTERFGNEITWFNSDCNWDDEGFELTGVLVGLALYNSVLLDVHFPMAVYRKLLGFSLGLEDMVDVSLKNGFQQLLDYEGDDVEYVFCLNFEVTWLDDLREEQKVELKPGGSNIPVTSANKEEYVRLYVKWLLVDSIYPQWDSFERGVMRVMEGSSLNLFRPEELELLVVGTPELDFDALESNTEYEGYDKKSDVVRNFWKFVKNADRESQLNFLKFSTGSSMAPIGGLGELAFKIQRAGPDSPQLPTSHTCFNTLLLPDYGADYDKLVERLSRAIVECEGFGLA